jgi:Carboxypeptidase regulatory-like domain
MYSTFRLLSLFVVLCCFSFAQSDSAVSGVVSDPTGAVFPGASVTIVNIDNGAQREATTDSSGRYSFQQIAPGKYKLVVKAAGFNDVTVNSLQVLVNSPATIDIKMESMGRTTTTVDVTSETVQINTQDATLGNAIGTKPIMELPFEARNVVGLLSIQPGVTFFGDPTDYRSGSVNGGKADQGNVTLDGVDVNDQQYRSAFTSVLRVTLDSVQEFRTTTTNGGADVGRTSGAQVALVTKGGSNEFHGSLYEYHRNTSTSANSFFNNLDGVNRQKLIRNVFGASLGGPIKKNKAFFFLNYEGRRDASEQTTIRTVPNALFRQGIFTYTRTDGTTGQLTPPQIASQVDPTGLGVDPNVLAVLQKYPMPNDNSVGDGINTAGYRFTSAAPLSYNTYIARLDYQLDSAGKHLLFWRGNLQNDNATTGAPQFPGEAASSQHLENSKGFAVGYTWIATPSLVNNFHYGFTRQGYDDTGLQTQALVDLRGMDNLYPNTRSLSATIPVHDFEDSATWTKGAHTVQFGGSMRFISTHRLNFGNSFSGAVANSSWFGDQGSGLFNAIAAIDPLVDPGNYTSLTRSMTDLLGFVTEGDAQYNYDKNGTPLAEGTGIKRDFIDREYEIFLQDSWKVKHNLTITGGLRVSFFPPLFEANGYQTSTNVPLADWFNIRGGLAEAGESQALAPVISYQLSNQPGGRGLYPFQNHYSPRVAFAWSPELDTPGGRLLFGGPGKSSIRGGVGLYYDLFGQSLIRLADSYAIGLSTQLTNPANADYATTPRYVSPTAVPAGLFLPAPPGGFPQDAPDAFAITQGLDSGLKAPYTINMNLTMSRDLAKGLLLQASYVGRLSRHTLQGDDVAAPTNLIDAKSGQSYFQAATIMQTYLRAHPAATAADTAGLAPIPFFENVFPGYAGNGITATQALYSQQWPGGLYNDTGPLANIDAFGVGPGSVLGPNAMFNSQFSSLAVFRSRGSGSYHAFQLTLRKQFAGVQFDLNYTFSKSMDLGSQRESDNITGYSNTNQLGQIINPWNTAQMRAVSDYDARHQVSAFFVADLPFGRGRRWGNNWNGFVNAVLGGWGSSGIWRMSSGLPIGVTDGGQWATNWNLSGWATAIAPISSNNTKNSATGGPNIFTDPDAGYAAFTPNFPGTTGSRNILRGYGIFNLDVALQKRFIMPWSERHSLQLRAEAFNVTNSAQFDVNTMNLDISSQANFGKYTSTLGNPRVMQFGARYEF